MAKPGQYLSGVKVRKVKGLKVGQDMAESIDGSALSVHVFHHTVMGYMVLKVVFVEILRF